MDLQTKLEQLFQQNNDTIKKVKSLDELNQIRVQLLGKKGPITGVLRGMKDLSAEERPKVGAFANKIRDDLSAVIEARKAHYNFEMMNIPKDHPARDMQETFYITNELLMRSQTSPMQARTTEKHDFTKGPLKMISPGVVYRRDDDDATHSHQFHQMEGLVIDKHITMADLKGTLLAMCQHVFGKDRTIRLRPSYFPFTEPSVEVDVSCFRCGGKGCPVCKYTGWIEVLGAGMVHPNVLRAANIDADVYGGFAFGLGPDRFAMLKYGIDDIRSFYTDDLRFLTQFSQEG